MSWFAGPKHTWFQLRCGSDATVRNLQEQQDG